MESTIKLISKYDWTLVEVIQWLDSNGHSNTKIRESKKKTWPAFGVEMYLLQCIIQCNKALNEKEKNEDTTSS